MSNLELDNQEAHSFITSTQLYRILLDLERNNYNLPILQIYFYIRFRYAEHGNKALVYCPGMEISENLQIGLAKVASSKAVLVLNQIIKYCRPEKERRSRVFIEILKM